MPYIYKLFVSDNSFFRRNEQKFFVELYLHQKVVMQSLDNEGNEDHKYSIIISSYTNKNQLLIVNGYCNIHLLLTIPSEITTLISLYIPYYKPLKIGDHIKLESGKVGIIRYIGQPNFASEELIGIELDFWSCNAGNGTINNQKIFCSSPGRGYFASRKSIVKIVYKPKMAKAVYARLKGLVILPMLKSKRTIIIRW